MPEDPSRGERLVQRAWSTGRYPSIAPNLLPPIAHLVHAGGIDPGDVVLDVGCGTGNVALTAHRSGASVVGVDITRQMLDLAADSATIAGADDIAWVGGDATGLPFADTAFDVVLSNFGHIFAPDVHAASAELCRVTEAGGRVAFTAWSPDGLVGELASLLSDHTGRRADPPWAFLEWGDPAYVAANVDGLREVTFERRIARFRYVSPAHFWRDFAEESGPLSPVLATIDDPSVTAALRRDALDALEDWFADNAVRVQYLLVRGLVE